MKVLYGFIFCMWILILIGGGISVSILGPISISGFGAMNSLLTSIVKGIISVLLVVLWIVILSKVKQWIFVKSIND